MTLCERIDKIDKLLFDAGVLVLAAKTNAARTLADHKIIEAHPAQASDPDVRGYFRRAVHRRDETLHFTLAAR